MKRQDVTDQPAVASAERGAIVVASHDPEVAARCAAQVRLADGIVVEMSEPRRQGK